MYTSFALFTEDKQFNVINGTYQDPGDLYFAVYVDGEIANIIPSKDSGYTLDTERSSCTNGATITWDNTSWSALVNLSNYSAANMSRTKCTMYFKEQSFNDSILACDDTAVNCLMQNAGKNTIELAYDNTTDNNLRYIGSNSSNYVSFNGELWRIIGVMNNIELEDGTTTSLLKLIRNESIGNYSYDNTRMSLKTNYNDAAIKETLNNGPYWNRTSGNCPLLPGMMGNTTTTPCDMSNTGLTNEAKAMITNAYWNLGTVNLSSTISEIYTQKRAGDSTWTGYVGLMYPSDFLYSANLSEDCLNVTAEEGNDRCYNDSYITTIGYTITSASSSSGYVIRAGSGLINIAMPAYATMPIYPSVYLNQNVKITDGAGTETDPYNLSL